MHVRIQKRAAGQAWNRARSASIFVGSFLVLVLGGVIQSGNAATTPTSTARSTSNANAHATRDALPVFKLIEGAKGSPDPYTPRVLHIPAGQRVALEITDNIGGCAMVTLFPGLGTDGKTVRARVPVGQTRRIIIRAAKPGRYRYHCAGHMYFGEIVAR